MPLTRRTFLLGGASAAALAACGGSDDDASRSIEDSSTTAAGSALAIARVFSPTQPRGTELRLPIALADADGGLLDTAPPSITIRYGLEGTTERSAPIEVRRHDQGIPTPYFPVRVDLPELGTWAIEVDADGRQATTTVEAVEAKDVPAVPKPAEQLIPVQTPTIDDARGVEPICTREPACPFHEQTLAEAMGGDKAIAFIISTPQFCQTAICGPVLDLLVERHEQHADVMAFVHAEVYTDDSANVVTEAVQAYGLTWEPSLFLARPDGTIASRLDYTYDAVELDEALGRLLR